MVFQPLNRKQPNLKTTEPQTAHTHGTPNSPHPWNPKQPSPTEAQTDHPCRKYPTLADPQTAPTLIEPIAAQTNGRPNVGWL